MTSPWNGDFRDDYFVGGALSRLALAAFLRGAREMKEHGAFTWVGDTVPTRDLRAIFG